MTKTIEITRLFAVGREALFQAWTDPQYLLQWFAPAGCTIHYERLEIKPGGKFHSCVRTPTFGDCWCVGTYTEVFPPEKLVFTMATADAYGNVVEPVQAGHDATWPRETTVTVRLEEHDGGTKMTLTQNVSEKLAKQTGAYPSWIQMLDRLERLLMGALVAVLSCSAFDAMAKGAFADVNGIRMYYEDHGKGGTPLVLLHGGGSTIDVTFGKVLPLLARHRRVIAVEEQGHGRTTDRDRPFRFETSADDVATLLKQLKIGSADVFGFSNGATVALQVAIRHPELVRKLVFASAFTTRAGAQPWLWKFMDEATFDNMPQELKDAFLKVTPDPKRLRNMHDKDAQRMRDFKDIPDELVRKVRAPTLIVAGDRDVVTLDHAVALTRLFPKARLLLLPGGHGDYLAEPSTEIIEQFLDAPPAD